MANFNPTRGLSKFCRSLLHLHDECQPELSYLSCTKYGALNSAWVVRLGGRSSADTMFDPAKFE